MLSMIIGAIGIYGERNLNTVNTSVETVYKQSVITLSELKNISDMYAMDIDGAIHKMANGTISLEEGKNSIKKAQEEIDKSWQAYTNTTMPEDERNVATAVKQLIDASNESIESLIRIIDSGNTAALNNYSRTELYSKIDPVNAKIKDLSDIQLKEAQSEYIKADSIYTEARNNGYLFIISGILLGFIISFFIIKNIVNIVSKLKELIAFVQVASDNISSASTQMSSSSQQMSEGATEQAASAEEVSSSMEEIAKDAALYADAKNFEDIAGKMMLIYKDEKLRKELIEKGKIIAARYSWQRTAELLWQSILKAVN